MKHAQPLVSEPSDFNRCLGLLNINDYEFQDVWSLDAADFDRSPLAFSVVLPVTASIRTALENSNLIPVQQLSTSGVFRRPPVWIQQTIRNSCGHVSILHIVANTLKLNMDENISQTLEKFIDDHLKLSTENGDNVVSDEVEDHYYTFIEYESHVICLDGRSENVYDFGIPENPLKCILKLIKDIITANETDCPSAVLALYPQQK